MANAADRAHMRQAIDLMRQAGVVERTGGPFGAVVVRDGVVLGAAGNSVLHRRKQRDLSPNISFCVSLRAYMLDLGEISAEIMALEVAAFFSAVRSSRPAVAARARSSRR